MATKSKKILIIDDDKILCSMYKTKMEVDNFKVFVTNNGNEGIKLARKKKPDLILLDVIMPQIDGFAVLEELKKDDKTKNIPVIILTNLGTDEDKEKGEKIGAVDYLVKADLTPTQITEKIKRILK